MSGKRRDASSTPAEVGQAGGRERLPRALGRPAARYTARAPADAEAYGSLAEWLEDMFAIAAARVHCAIVDAWQSGRLRFPQDDPRAVDQEVRALTGMAPSADDALAQSRQGMLRVQERTAGRIAATINEGRRLPLIELVADHRLSTVEANILWAVAAAGIWSEIQRLYDILAGDPRRTLCDIAIVEQILGGNDVVLRTATRRALRPGARLLQTGLVLAAGDGPHARLTVDPALLARIRGDATPLLGPASVRMQAFTTLEEFPLAADFKDSIVRGLADERGADDPLRLLLRGRGDAGGLVFLCALAAKVGREVARIDVDHLPAAVAEQADALAVELRRAFIAGCVPCVVNIESFGEGDVLARVREVIRAHPGPVAFCIDWQTRLPWLLGTEVQLRTPDPAQRLAMWQAALADRGLEADALADGVKPFRSGHPTVEYVVDKVARSLGDDRRPATVTRAVARTLADELFSRLGRLSTRVTDTAVWPDLVAPTPTMDALKVYVAEVDANREAPTPPCARVRLALFTGERGVGKSLAARVVANALGATLFRIEAARLPDGEDPQALRRLRDLFALAETGPAILLVTQAEAWLRVEGGRLDRLGRWLLDRLDTFEGVAIFETRAPAVPAIWQPRFESHVAFPMPDAWLRQRIWRRALDGFERPAVKVDELAEKYPLCGADIMRAAEIAGRLAGAGRPLTHADAERGAAAVMRVARPRSGLRSSRPSPRRALCRPRWWR